MGTNLTATDVDGDKYTSPCSCLTQSLLLQSSARTVELFASLLSGDVNSASPPSWI